MGQLVPVTRCPILVRKEGKRSMDEKMGQKVPVPKCPKMGNGTVGACPQVSQKEAYAD